MASDPSSLNDGGGQLHRLSGRSLDLAAIASGDEVICAIDSGRGGSILECCQELGVNI